MLMLKLLSLTVSGYCRWPVGGNGMGRYRIALTGARFFLVFLTAEARRRGVF
jgi:hypothetical protein